MTQTFSKFLFGSETNLSTPVAHSSIPLQIVKMPEDFFDSAQFLGVVAKFSNAYQRANLRAYNYRGQVLLWFTGEHETGMWSYVLKPIVNEVPEISLFPPEK